MRASPSAYTSWEREEEREMHIDTRYEATRSVVKIVMQNDQERGLSDDDWKRVAFNQHRLLWRDKDSGAAVLPRRLSGTRPGDTTTLLREGDHISVIFPYDE